MSTRTYEMADEFARQAETQNHYVGSQNAMSNRRKYLDAYIIHTRELV